MNSSTHRSHARWPEGTFCSADQHQISTDNHPDEQSAKSVCKLLEAEGFGGDGEIFPLETWVTPIPFEEQYPEEGEILMEICQERGVQREQGKKLKPIFLDSPQEMTMTMTTMYENAHPSCKPVTTIRRVEEKIGRNDKCPCGSDKKYKKCCIIS